jgi:hypothetical protein
MHHAYAYAWVCPKPHVGIRRSTEKELGDTLKRTFKRLVAQGGSDNRYIDAYVPPDLGKILWSRPGAARHIILSDADG